MARSIKWHELTEYFSYKHNNRWTESKGHCNSRQGNRHLHIDTSFATTHGMVVNGAAVSKGLTPELLRIAGNGNNGMAALAQERFKSASWAQVSRYLSPLKPSASCAARRARYGFEEVLFGLRCSRFTIPSTRNKKAVVSPKMQLRMQRSGANLSTL
eukprot:SAG31_NODE_825_length_11760_cov_5.637767_4_plen_157_part_00